MQERTTHTPRPLTSQRMEELLAALAQREERRRAPQSAADLLETAPLSTLDARLRSHLEVISSAPGLQASLRERARREAQRTWRGTCDEASRRASASDHAPASTRMHDGVRIGESWVIERNPREAGEEEHLVVELNQALRDADAPPDVLREVCYALDLVGLILDGTLGGLVSASSLSQDRPPERWAHSEDFVSVRWDGTLFTFTKVQAACVRALWEAADAGTPVLSQETLQEKSGSNRDTFRLDHVFRESKTSKPHPAWGAMIVSVGKGLFSLAERHTRRHT
jgi:hypothetical protein